MDIPLALTFDDVLLEPQYSEIESRSDVLLDTKLTKNIKMKAPLVSSNMDTVTEDPMAIEMARCGGIGIIHRYCTVEEQVAMVKRVKRAGSYIIREPYWVVEDDNIGKVKEMIDRLKVHSFVVLGCKMTRNDKDKLRVVGLLTRRDIRGKPDHKFVSHCMTPLSQLVLGRMDMGMDEAKQVMVDIKKNRLPVIDSDGKLQGLICLKDIVERLEVRPHATLDDNGQLRCGAAIGVKKGSIDRAKALIDAGADVIVIDIAHGHSKMCIDTLKEMKQKFPTVEVIAGNIATAEGALALIEAGADAVKCSIGSGSICVTRTVAGAGVPQFTALLNASRVCRAHGVPLISDGGNRNSGNMAKALAAGADSIMVGRMIAGTDESPGDIRHHNGRRVKMIRGMAGLHANLDNARKNGSKKIDTTSFTPEGVEGYVPYSGPVRQTVKSLCDGIRSGMSYSGARNLEELRLKARFVRMTNNGKSESGVHDIIPI